MIDILLTHFIILLKILKSAIIHLSAVHTISSVDTFAKSLQRKRYKKTTCDMVHKKTTTTTKTCISDIFLVTFTKTMSHGVDVARDASPITADSDAETEKTREDLHYELSVEVGLALMPTTT